MNRATEIQDQIAQLQMELAELDQCDAMGPTELARQASVSVTIASRFKAGDREAMTMQIVRRFLPYTRTCPLCGQKHSAASSLLAAEDQGAGASPENPATDKTGPGEAAMESGS